MSLPANRMLPSSKNAPAQLGEHPILNRLARIQYWETPLAMIVGCALGLAVILSTYYVENPKLALGLVGGPAFVLMTIRWPEMGILFLIAMTDGLIDLHWLPLLKFGAFSIHLQEIFLGVLWVLALMRLMTREDYPLIRSPLTLPLFLFLIAVVVSIVHGMWLRDLSMNTGIQRGRSWGLWALFFPLIQLVRDRLTTERLIKGLWLLAALIGFGVLVRMVYPGLHPFIIPVDTVTLRTMGEQYSGVDRLFNIKGAPLLYAMIPVTVATLALIGHERLSKRWQVFLLILLALLLNWLVRSFQRSLWISTTLNCVLLFIFISPRERLQLIRRLIPLMLAAVIGLAVYRSAFPYDAKKLFSSVTDRLMSLTTSSLDRADDSVNWRIIENHYALESVKSSPLFGIGIGNEYRPPFEREILWNEYGLRWFIHNSYLWVLVTAGFAGLLPFVVLCAVFVGRALMSWRQVTDKRLQAVYLGLVLSFLGQMISNITAPTFLDGPPQAIYPVIMGLCECILYVSRQEQAALLRARV